MQPQPHTQPHTLPHTLPRTLPHTHTHTHTHTNANNSLTERCLQSVLAAFCSAVEALVIQSLAHNHRAEHRLAEPHPRLGADAFLRTVCVCIHTVYTAALVVGVGGSSSSRSRMCVVQPLLSLQLFPVRTRVVQTTGMKTLRRHAARNQAAWNLLCIIYGTHVGLACGASATDWLCKQHA